LTPTPLLRTPLTVDQEALLTQNIEDSFSAKKKVGGVLVDLTVAYDTVWHRGLTCKLLRLLPDSHMVRMILELFGSRSFLTGNNTPLPPLKTNGAVYGASNMAPHGIYLGTPSFQHLNL